LRELLACYGVRDFLGYFLLWCDKLVVFLFSGKVVVVYCVVDGVSFVLGDLVGDFEVWLGVIWVWFEEVDWFVWMLGVFGVS